MLTFLDPDPRTGLIESGTNLNPGPQIVTILISSCRPEKVGASGAGCCFSPFTITISLNLFINLFSSTSQMHGKGCPLCSKAGALSYFLREKGKFVSSKNCSVFDMYVHSCIGKAFIDTVPYASTPLLLLLFMCRDSSCGNFCLRVQHPSQRYCHS